MDALSFDRLTRRYVLGGFAAAFGLGTAGLPDGASAKKLKRNEFGCVNVGGKCRGRASTCCSGVCRGKKPKQGERDKSRCVAHDAGTGCQAGQREEGCGGSDLLCTTATGFEGVCDTTTGKAAYCVFGFECIDCRKDAECRNLCGPAAACIKCPNCDGFETACVGPSQGDCSV